MKNNNTEPINLALHELVGQSDMTLGELITSYKQAPKKNLQLHALAELTLLPEEKIVELLLANGVKQQELPRARKQKAAKEAVPENFSGGVAEVLPEPEEKAVDHVPPEQPHMRDQTIKADAGKPELRLVPWQIVRDIAEVRGYGNRKYGDSDSWRRVDIDRYIDALLRHVIAFAEDPSGRDAESGIEHYKHAACNLAFIAELMKGENNG